MHFSVGDRRLLKVFPQTLSELFSKIIVLAVLQCVHRRHWL